VTPSSATIHTFAVRQPDRQRKAAVMTTSLQTPTPLDPVSTRLAWDTIAAGYARHVTPTHSLLANEALDHIDLLPGMRFLDVAAGSGALALAAASRGAEVLGTDISPVMIEHLKHTAQRSGLANLSGQVMDGHNLNLEDDAIDAAGSMFGVMLFPDLPRGLREMARVTKPGGPVLMVTFGPPSRIEFLGFFLSAVKRVIPGFTGLPTDPPPLPFQVSDPARLQQAMHDAGLTAVEVETTTETQEFDSSAHLWNWIASSNPIGARLTGDLPPDQATSVREVLDGMLSERSGGKGPARLTHPINIAVGTA
jgi:ubiquinone/menaquinone biosynthesis C-methylase UbiE